MSGGRDVEQVQRTGIDNGGGTDTDMDNVPALRQSEHFSLTNHVLFVFVFCHRHATQLT